MKLTPSTRLITSLGFCLALGSTALPQARAEYILTRMNIIEGDFCPDSTLAWLLLFPICAFEKDTPSGRQLMSSIADNGYDAEAVALGHELFSQAFKRLGKNEQYSNPESFQEIEAMLRSYVPEISDEYVEFYFDQLQLSAESLSRK